MAKEVGVDGQAVASDFVEFLNAAPTAFHAVDEAKRRLKEAGYVKIGFEVTKGGFLEIGVQTYGGGLWHTWFDRDLTVAGRVMIKENIDGTLSYSHKLVRIQEPILRIPTLAIHLDRSVNDGFKVNPQTHLVPVLATAIKAEVNKVSVMNDKCTSECNGDGGVYVEQKQGQEKKEADGGDSESLQHHLLLLQLVASRLGCEPEEICDFELQLCDTQPSLIAGAAKEFVFSGRLDNLCMSFCSLKALIDATASSESLEDETGIRMIALFDHEEVGSNSAQGAGSPVMLDAVSRVTCSFTASDSKDFVVRNDMPCGSTIGPILASGVGIRTVDVGAPQLSMHSIREMCGVDDVVYSYQHFKAFLEEYTKIDSQIKVDC